MPKIPIQGSGFVSPRATASRCPTSTRQARCLVDDAPSHTHRRMLCITGSRSCSAEHLIHREGNRHRLQFALPKHRRGLHLHLADMAGRSACRRSAPCSVIRGWTRPAPRSASSDRRRTRRISFGKYMNFTQAESCISPRPTMGAGAPRHSRSSPSAGRASDGDESRSVCLHFGHREQVDHQLFEMAVQKQGGRFRKLRFVSGLVSCDACQPGKDLEY